jgi:hypothetical protein
MTTTKQDPIATAQREQREAAARYIADGHPLAELGMGDWFAEEFLVEQEGTMRTIKAWVLIREMPFGYEHSAFAHEGIDVALFETRTRAMAFKRKLRLTCIKPVRVTVQIGAPA